nr:uncharacterized protein CTRU02_14908 [Colletotrichum truncatum]KAF6781610.1 hypothetical protein CTRU02_14908 [Colletotrichum truncatum]
MLRTDSVFLAYRSNLLSYRYVTYTIVLPFLSRLAIILIYKS